MKSNHSTFCNPKYCAF